MQGKWLRILVVMTAIGLLLGISGLTGFTQIKQVKFTTAEMDPSQFQFYDWMVKEYEKQNPDITVTVEKVGMRAQQQIFIGSIAAGEPVGIYQLRGGEVLDFAPRGVLMPLDSVAANVDFYPAAEIWIEDHVWGVGQLFNTTALWARKDLLAEAGLLIPRSLQDLLQAATKMTVDEDGDGVIDIYGIALPGSEGAVTDSVCRSFFWQKGTGLMDREYKPIIANNPRIIETLNYLKQLLQYAPPDAASWGWMGHREAYRAQNAAMSLSWGRVLNRIGREQPDLAKVTSVTPRPSGVVDAVDFSGDYYVLGRTAKNPEEHKEFLEWLTTKALLRLCAAMPGHDLPPTKAAGNNLVQYLGENPDIYPDQTQYVKEHSDWIRTFVKIAASGINRHLQEGAVINGEIDRSFVNPNTNPAIAARIANAPTLTGQMIHKVTYEGWTPENTAAWAQKEIESMMK